jgi:hypothetical protein
VLAGFTTNPPVRSRVPLFENGIVQVNTSVGTISSLIWDPANTSTSTFGSLGSVPSGASLKDVTVINTGASTIYLGSGSISATSQTGLSVAAGQQLTIQGYTAAGGNTAGRIWAQTGVVGQASSTQVGLASVASVV